MTAILVVANEPVWPVNGGGRARIAGLVTALAEHFETAVVQPGPVEPAPGNDAVRVHGLARRSSPASLGHFVHWHPRLGRAILPSEVRAGVRRVIGDLRPRVVMFTHSYLAPGLDCAGRVRVVDFPNIEIARMRSFAGQRRGAQRLSAQLERYKAQWWEPRVARGCDLAVAVSSQEASVLTRWGARTVTVPNAAPSRLSWSPSPTDGPVTYLANARYGPNCQAAQFLVREVWPLVRGRAPSAELRLVGRGMDDVMGWARAVPGVSVMGEVPDVGPHFRAAAVVAAPVTSGAGTQLKVVEALSHGRTVVATPYSARSVPAGAEIACRVARDAVGFAEALVSALGDPAERHRREMALAREWDPMSWSSAATPLIAALRTFL